MFKFYHKEREDERNCFVKGEINIKAISIKDVKEKWNTRLSERKGEWIVKDREICVEYTCSVCGHTYCEGDPEFAPEDYCCKCGAKNKIRVEEGK